MKKIISFVIIALFTVFAYAGNQPVKQAETKKVCVDKLKDGKPVKDKNGKSVQQCKNMKVHKKLEGTKVPEKK